MTSSEGHAARGWRAALESWAIPDEILQAAPESPWSLPVSLFRRTTDELNSDTPSRRRALEALPIGGSVLDVGCGAGAASLALVPRADRVLGVDSSREMLAAFAEAGAMIGVDHAEAEGSWPTIAPDVGAADVVVCHHVVYNAPDLGPFVLALEEHAGRRVVIEMTRTHPQSSLNDLWLHFHALRRPDRPTADDAIAVLAELGIEPAVDFWESPLPNREGASRAEWVSFVRRRLCLPAEREPEVEALLGERELGHRSLVTLSFEPRA